MPRLPRIYIKDALYFISCRAEHNENIFQDEEDYKMFLELMKKYQQQYGIKIFAYVLMPSHLHLLVEMEKSLQEQESKTQKFQEISDFMHDLNNNYTKYYNNRYNRKGHLFRERFKSAIIEKDEYLLKMTAYIHLNPQRLNLVSDAKDYPHSSYQLYLYDDAAGKKDLLQFTQGINEVLKLLSGNDYAQYVDSLTKEDGDYIHKKLQYGGILGSEEFVKQIKAEVEAYQAQGLGQKYEVIGKQSYKLFLILGSLFLVLIVGTGGIYLLFINRPSKQPEQFKVLRNETLSQKTEESEDLKDSEWQVKLIPVVGGNEAIDMLSFTKGKFLSIQMNSLGFPNSNYSLVIGDNGKIIWETMQKRADGMASWKGEIEHGQMRGTLSLRQQGKEPQDFSFTSTKYKYRRKE
jgi:REP element-mobilizing transposase RayT